jgi:hypothetical protein
MAETARILGKAVGKPDLAYRQFPYEDAFKGMVGAGVSEEMAGLYVEMNRAFNEGRVHATQARSPETTTPTSPETWAERVFAPAFRAG